MNDEIQKAFLKLVEGAPEFWDGLVSQNQSMAIGTLVVLFGLTVALGKAVAWSVGRLKEIGKDFGSDISDDFPPMLTLVFGGILLAVCLGISIEQFRVALAPELDLVKGLMS